LTTIEPLGRDAGPCPRIAALPHTRTGGEDGAESADGRVFADAESAGGRVLADPDPVAPGCG
jgi:hypothetical protein